MLTASVAAWEGQIGQIPYASAKAGIVGHDAGRRARPGHEAGAGVHDRARRLRHADPVAVLRRDPADGWPPQVPHPARLGRPEEFASLALQILDNPMLNGETIRLDGAIRMQPR